MAAGFSAEFAANKSVSFSSSMESVAKVSTSGVVTAIGNGTAIITVTTADGKKTASGTIRVSVKVNKPGKVTGVTSKKQTKSSMILSWKKQSNAESYKIYLYDTKTKK